MALKPTIYKFRIGLSDLDRDYYDNLALTVAQHPSETVERMMARVMAYCICAEPELAFTKGLCAADEPDIWLKQDNGDIDTWLDVGEPDPERIKKASHLATKVKVFSFNSKSAVWWQQNGAKFTFDNVQCYRFEWQQIVQLASLIERSFSMAVTITGNSAYIHTDKGESELSWQPLEFQH